MPDALAVLIAATDRPPDWVFALLGIAFGAFAIAGGLSNWGWWWNNRRARFLSSIISQTGARVFYVAIGVLLLLFGILLGLGIIEAPRK